MADSYFASVLTHRIRLGSGVAYHPQTVKYARQLLESAREPGNT